MYFLYLLVTLIGTLETKLQNDPEGLKLLTQLTNSWISKSEDLEYYKLICNGDWSGLEELKGYNPLTHKIVKRTAEEIAEKQHEKHCTN